MSVDYTEQHPLVGSFHRFGESGVAYEVLRLQDETHARIRVLESGEELSYPVKDIAADPQAD